MVKVDGIPVIQDPVDACRLLEHDTIIGFDMETTGLRPQVDSIAVMQFYGDNTGTLAVLQIHDGIIPQCIVDLLQSPKHMFIGHNVVNFDLAFLKTHGVDWKRAKWYDTLVAETVITSTGRRNVSVSLRNSVRRRLGLEIDKSIAHGSWDKDLTVEQISYAARDVISLPALRRAQLEKSRETNQEDALTMEMELMPYVSMMYATGLPLRKDILTGYIAKQQVLAEKLAREIYELLGPLNLNSPIQILKALRLIGCSITSTATEVLIDTLIDGKITPKARRAVELILEYRKPAQLIKMYDEEWAEKFIINDRVHSQFWQCSADTGRFTSSNPNLQQWPKVMREVIGNVDGLTIVSGDYSQIEVRIAAVIAQDEDLIRVLQEDDVHTAVAAEVYKLDPATVSKQQRKNAKALTFALLYDGTPSTLYRHSRTSGGTLTYNECIGMEKLFFETFKGLQRMRSRARLMAKRPGVVVIRLPNGARRILAGENKRASTILNTIVQGTAAVGIKYGILEAGRRGLVEGLMGAQVHDELVAAVPDNEAEEYEKELSEAMVVGMSKVLPGIVKVETKRGKHWEV